MPQDEEIVTLATPEQIARARGLYADDDCEIDDGARVSGADGGLWVAAWVWLPNGED